MQAGHKKAPASSDTGASTSKLNLDTGKLSGYVAGVKPGALAVLRFRRTR